MKNKFSVILMTFVFLSIPLFAQDPVKVASNVYKKVLLENDDVRVVQIEFKKGETAAMHNHPRHVVYIIQGGELMITEQGGKPVDYKLKSGEAVFMPAVTHTAKNVGTTVIKGIVIEIKK